MLSGDEAELRRLLEGYRSTALLHAAAHFGIPAILSGGPLPTQEVAALIGANPQALGRLLRGLAVLGVCTQEEGGRFGLTPLGDMLCPGRPGRLHDMAVLIGAEYAPAWMGLPHSVRTGAAAFDLVFGVSPWEHRRGNSHLDAHFNEWLTSATNSVADGILAACDFSRFATVADIGGGGGGLLLRLLGSHPAMRGVLFDREHVLAGAARHVADAGLSHRCEFVAGDFFEAVPVRADALILKSVLHDWDDVQCRRILANCRRSMTAGAVLLLVERFLPARAADDRTATMIDLHMLAVTGGRERTESEYRALLDASGFRPARMALADSGFAIMESVPAEA